MIELADDDYILRKSALFYDFCGIKQILLRVAGFFLFVYSAIIYTLRNQISVHTYRLGFDFITALTACYNAYRLRIFTEILHSLVKSRFEHK